MAANRFVYFFAGVVVGAAGLAMVKTQKGQEFVSGIVNDRCGLAGKVLDRVEAVKEDFEGYMTEIKYKAEQTKGCAQGAVEQEEVERFATAEIDIEAEKTSETGKA